MLSDSVWNSNLLAQFATIAFVGTSVPELTSALSKGFTDHIVGKSFSTTDNGTIGTIGGGNGLGVGLTVSASVISSGILASLQAKGFSGTQLIPMCQAIGNACSITLLTATFTSTHTLISGTGTVTASSIAVVANAMSQEIQNNTVILEGDKFADLCDGVAEGLVNAIKNTGVASVTITPVTPGDIPVSPGTGTGVGAIS